MHEEVGTGEPLYLELADALQLYAAIIGGTLAQAADQLRDQGALEGALGRPRSYADYEDADLALQAAVLAHGIAESQAFIDANKRLALVVMLTFLEPAPIRSRRRGRFRSSSSRRPDLTRRRRGERTGDWGRSHPSKAAVGSDRCTPAATIPWPSATASSSIALGHGVTNQACVQPRWGGRPERHTSSGCSPP
jgi:Fic/DOC family